MKHYGDITKLSGYTLPTVDVICGGSPCQDLSLAGKRKGLSGERSGLFMEQIRIIREMREKDGSTGRSGFMVRPRFGIWENVPGAFSSNGGADFQAVLTEFVRIAEPEAPDVPMPEDGKWPKSGIILGDGFSVSWRLHDAQFWGVAQRRKRISLVADFGGHSAPEILFEREGLRGNPTESRETQQGTPTNPENGVDDTVATVIILNDQGGERMDVSENVTATLRAQANHPPLVVEAAGFCLEHSAQARGIGYEEGVSPTLRAGVVPGVIYPFAKGTRPHSAEEGQQWKKADVANTLNTHDVGETRCNELIVYGISSYDSNAMKSDNPHSGIYEADTARTLDLNGGNPACNQGGMAVVAIENHPNDSRVRINEDGVCQALTSRMGTGGGNVPLVMDVGFFQAYEDKAGTLLARQYKDPPIMVQRRFSEDDNIAIVRRLTPLECERLQGFPDFWTDIGDWIDSKGKKHKGDSDAPRYKALGNSISLPFWQYLARRICAQYERDITMGSLFDGIGGFPLVFERCGAKAVWASEIEEFPIAVTKKHFPEPEKGAER